MSRTKKTNKKSKPLNVDPKRFDSGTASRNLDQVALNYKSMVQPIWDAIEQAKKSIDQNSPGDIAIHGLLLSMQETHKNLIALIKASEKAEAKGNLSGRCTDAFLLARAQYEAAFISLLIAHDELHWVPQYGKSGWRSHALRHFFMYRRFQNTPQGAKLNDTNKKKLEQSAKWLVITKEEWEATEAEALGNSPPAHITSEHKIDEMLTPGGARDRLKHSQFEQLSHLLYQQWKFLCDPSHVGIATMWLRTTISNTDQQGFTKAQREEFIHNQIIVPSVIPSLVAVLSTLTVFLLRHPDNSELTQAISDAWDQINTCTIEGSIIWDEWARDVLAPLTTQSN